MMKNCSIVMDLFHISIITCGVCYMIKNNQQLRQKLWKPVENLLNKECSCQNQTST